MSEPIDYLTIAKMAEHARRMSVSDHTAGCEVRQETRWAMWEREAIRMPAPSDGREIPFPETCDGCMSDEERALWGRIAAEMDAYRG